MGTNVTANITCMETEKKVNVDLDAGATLVDGSATTLFGLEADNSANTVDVYVKCYNNASPSVGSTAPELVRRVLAGAKQSFLLAGGDGFAFSTAISAACTTEAGEAGTTSPTNDVPVTFWTD